MKLQGVHEKNSEVDEKIKDRAIEAVWPRGEIVWSVQIVSSVLSWNRRRGTCTRGDHS